MITPAEDQYIQTIPEDKKVTIHPYDPGLKTIADSIIAKIKQHFPDIDVLFMGASGLGISGQGDIDIYALSHAEDFHLYLPTFKSLFGIPTHEHQDSVEWAFDEDGHDVELYLTDLRTSSMKRQLKVFKILQENADLLEEYKKLKEEMNGKSFRDYQRRKYEFYNRILAQEFMGLD